MSYCLRERGREHIILERSRIANRWYSERWDSLFFQFPNWSLRLPGFAYAGPDPDGFAHWPQIARFIEDYARFIDAPIRCGANVSSVREGSRPGQFLIETEDTQFLTSHVVMATGPFQRPAVPACSADFPASIFQVHASDYRNPNQLPAGAVLVVGSGASGGQIAEELYQDGRKVFLSVSRHRRVPRRYRGRDVLWWLLALGRMDTRIDSFPGRRKPPSLVITGVNGGHDIDVRRFAADGVTVLGRLLGAADGKIAFAPDSEPILAEADQAYADFKRDADAHGRAEGLDLPEDEPADPAPAAPLPTISTLDLATAGIAAVVWGTGYGYDFGWVKLPIFDAGGAPVQDRGVTRCAHAYFLGLHWMHTFKSGVFFGVGDDAAYLAEYIAGAHSSR